MAYTRTCQQIFYCPVTNRLHFSPEHSVTPPPISNCLEFKTVAESSPPASAKSASKLNSSQPQAPDNTKSIFQTQLTNSHWHISPNVQPLHSVPPRRPCKASDLEDPNHEHSTSNDIEWELFDLATNPEGAPSKDGNNGEDSSKAASSGLELEIDPADIICWPPGSAGQPGTHGYMLKVKLKKLGWTSQNIQDVTVSNIINTLGSQIMFEVTIQDYMQQKAPNYINWLLPYAQQDQEQVQCLYCKIKYVRDRNKVNDSTGWKQNGEEGAEVSMSTVIHLLSTDLFIPAIQEYTSRGFHILDSVAQLDHPCGSACPMAIRTLDDPESLYSVYGQQESTAVPLNRTEVPSDMGWPIYIGP
ncbi:hypothetical protein M422DRAFT_53844 [Sphaerobolus stellatus SS14]|uniref:Uncharacterized protein n=1 Tax=Sphaerobolus stellatus (strain SS14) TaxID=990650 RepID=A0A0C9UYJ9_SPHS4|nr:hypothetical protein M422DRAFT_53844 [Sphaerobolus stellatus SS14]